MDEATKLYSKKPEGISKRTYICYGVGHMINDLTSTMWFSYLLIFFHYALNFPEWIAGVMLLIGQLADGLATPVVGILSDKGAGHYLCKYGHRKSWHLVGSVCVAATFPFIFSPCFGFQYVGLAGKVFYYAIFIIIFQFGWAAVQISHLSLAPDLTPNQNERTGLLTIRYSFTVISNIIVHLFTWIIFISYQNHETPDAVIRAEDRYKFQMIAIFTVILGSAFSLIFHTGVKERNTVLGIESVDDGKRSCGADSRGNSQGDLGVSTIFKKKRAVVVAQFELYHIMGVYAVSQLFVNQCQVFVPLYLEEYLRIESSRLPIIPLVMFVSSSLTSIVAKTLNTDYGRKPAYVVGSILAIVVSAMVFVGYGTFYASYLIYGVAILLGCACSVIMVTSLGITADLIGDHTSHGAFIYGLMSFADKISNGFAVYIIQHIRMAYTSSPGYYRNVFILMCGGSAILGLLLVLCLPADFTLFRKEAENDLNNKTTNGIVIYCVERDNRAVKS